VVAPEDSAALRRVPPAAPAARSPSGPGSIDLILVGPIAYADIPALCARAGTLLKSGDADRLICDVAAVADPDAVTIEALARLQLTARRLGSQVRLRNVSGELQELLDFVGLNGVLPLSARSRIEARRQAEEREVRGGVEEEGDPADEIP
jgi:ABC-type transporter Mla MlaB component